MSRAPHPSGIAASRLHPYRTEPDYQRLARVQALAWLSHESHGQAGAKRRVAARICCASWPAGLRIDALVELERASKGGGA